MPKATGKNITKTTAPDAVLCTSGTDAAAIATMLQEKLELYSALDTLCVDPDARELKKQAQADFDNLQDFFRAMADAAPYTSATTPGGALFLAAVASDHHADLTANYHSDERRKDKEKELGLLLDALVRFLARQDGAAKYLPIARHFACVRSETEDLQLLTGLYRVSTQGEVNPRGARKPKRLVR